MFLNSDIVHSGTVRVVEIYIIDVAGSRHVRPFELEDIGEVDTYEVSSEVDIEGVPTWLQCVSLLCFATPDRSKANRTSFGYIYIHVKHWVSVEVTDRGVAIEFPTEVVAIAVVESVVAFSENDLFLLGGLSPTAHAASNGGGVSVGVDREHLCSIVSRSRCSSRVLNCRRSYGAAYLLDSNIRDSYLCWNSPTEVEDDDLVVA